MSENSETALNSPQRSGLGLGVVAGTSFVSALAGVAIGFGLFSLTSEDEGPSTDNAMTPSANIDFPTSENNDNQQGGANAGESNTSTQMRMQEYVDWEVVQYVVDANKECTFSPGFLDVEIALTNRSDAAILAGDAVVIITDLFGEEIMGLNTPIDYRIEPGESKVLGSVGDTCWDLGDYGGESRLKQMEDPYSATELVLEISRLALDNGEIVEF